MCSQVKPIRSIAPGAKFSTSTSASRISFSIIALPSGVLVFSVSDFLLLLRVMKYSASKSGMSRNLLRVTSPTPGRSTFSTSAPNHASNCVHAGPACTPVKSMILIPSRGRPMIKHSSLLMPLRTPCVVLAYLELRLSSVRVPCGCPVDFRATSTNGYSAWIAIGFTLVILCRDRRSSPMGDGLLGEPGVRPCISLARILQVGTTRARRRSDGPDGTGRCTSLPWQPGRQAQDQTQEKYPPNSGSPGSPAGQARQRKSASGVTAPMVRTALRVSVHVHHERTRYGTRNRPPRDRHTDRDHRRKPARRCTLGERIEAPKVLRDDVYVQDAVGRAETPLPRRAPMCSSRRRSVGKPARRPTTTDREATCALHHLYPHAVGICGDLVQLICKAAGGGAVYQKGPRDRCLHDILTANQQVIATARTYEMAGRLLLGLEPLRWVFLFVELAPNVGGKLDDLGTREWTYGRRVFVGREDHRPDRRRRYLRGPSRDDPAVESRCGSAVWLQCCRGARPEPGPDHPQASADAALAWFRSRHDKRRHEAGGAPDPHPRNAQRRRQTLCRDDLCPREGRRRGLGARLGCRGARRDGARRSTTGGGVSRQQMIGLFRVACGINPIALEESVLASC